MAGEIFFDNSALTSLFSEPIADRDALVAGLRTLGILRVSALNVIETARTPNPSLRHEKLSFYATLSGGVAPMNPPFDVLGAVAMAYRDKTGNFKAGDQYLYALLADPARASDELRAALTEHAKEHEHIFKSIHKEMRKHVLGLPKASSQSPDAVEFSTEKEFLGFAFANVEATLGHMVSEAYRDLTGAELAVGEVRKFLEAAPAWKIFIAAHLHSLWLRGICQNGPGKKKAGIVDTESAVYLNFCERFITNDRPQMEALLAANEYNPRKTFVDLYDALKSQFLINPSTIDGEENYTSS